MANKFLIIGVGSAGVTVADKIDIQNSKKLFIDTGCIILNKIQSEGEQLLLTCKDFGVCSGFCRCYFHPKFCEKVANDYENEIRESIINAFIEDK